MRSLHGFGCLGALTVIALGAVAAVGIVMAPAVTAAVSCAGVVIVVVLVRSKSPSHVFLWALALILLGYAFLGRPFAYLGIRPLFVGELVLGLGLLTSLTCSGPSRIFASPIVWSVVAFGLWGALRTLPYLPEYGWVALRDAVVWGYGAFAVLVGAAVMREDLASRLSRYYRLLTPLFLLWVPIWIALAGFFRDSLPTVPGTSVPVLEVRPSDVAVHLAGIGVFMTLGCIAPRSPPRVHDLRLMDWVWWSLWIVGFVAIASQTRAGLLAICVAFVMVNVYRPTLGWWRGAVVFAVLATAFLILRPSIHLGSLRAFSPEQVVRNLISVGGSEIDELEGTRQWRIEWWRQIVDDTLLGGAFWLGRGYGFNLAEDFDSAIEADEALRSPHNSHLTILARSGVTGFGLWLLLQAVFSISVLRALLRARRVGRRDVAALCLLILVYWAALMIIASFGVTLENPQAGIWYWTVVGVGVAAVETERRMRNGRPPPRDGMLTEVG